MPAILLKVAQICASRIKYDAGAVPDMLAPQEICRQILSLDNSIRFAGMANKMGRLVAAEFREGMQPLLTKEELEGYTMKAVLRMKTREDYGSKLGKIIYTYALYEKVKRASIALDSNDYSLLMVSFDITADHESIILCKILPVVKQGLAAATT